MYKYTQEEMNRMERSELVDVIEELYDELDRVEPSEKILCPACGSPMQISRHNDQIYDLFYYFCPNGNCGLVGPSRSTADDAFNAALSLTFEKE